MNDDDALMKMRAAVDAIIPKFAYCPHCGAKMDEEEDE